MKSLFTLLLFIVIAVSLGTSTAIKDHRLWLDEILSMILLSDGSIIHMTHAITTGIDANPPLFLYTYWLFGQDTLTLKITSILFFAVGVSVTYYYLASITKRPSLVFVVTLAIIALTGINYNLSSQIRNYALFLFLSSLYFIALHQFIRNPSAVKWLIWQGIVGLLLAFVHNFGLIYTAAAMASFLVLGIWARDNRYLSAVGVGLLIVSVWMVVWYPHFLIQSDTGKPYGWIPLPTVSSFFVIVDSLLPRIPVLSETSFSVVVTKVTALAILFVAVLFQSLRMGYREVGRDGARTLFLLSGGIFWGVTVLALMTSFAVTPIFYNRYFWPSHLLVIIQLVYLIRYVPTIKLRRLKPYVVAVIAIAGGAYLFRQNKKVSLFPEYVNTLSNTVSPNLPVFFEMIHEFLPADYYGLTNARYLLNWKAALRSKDTVDFKIIKAVREQYGTKEVVRESEFTKANYPRFYVMDNARNYLFEQYFESGEIRVVRQIKSPVSGVRVLECEWR